MREKLQSLTRVFIAAFLFAQIGAAKPPAKLIVLSWDGAPDWVIDRLLEADELPHLARLARGGARAEHSVSSVPTKTAPGHAAMWTGCWPGCNGITANDVPASLTGKSAVLELRRGFSSEFLRAEPIFITAAKAGKKVVLLAATHHEPPEPLLDTLRGAGVPRDRFLSFSGFEFRIARPRVYRAADLRPADREAWGWPEGGEPLSELTMALGETRIHALFFDDPDDPAEGLDTVLLRQGSRRAAMAVASALLKPRSAAAQPVEWSPGFRVRQEDRFGFAFFRLFDLRADGSSLTLYQRKTSALRGAYHPAQLRRYLAAYPGFYDDPFFLYRRGAFGRPLMAGGDGTAEERVLEITAFDAELLRRGTRFALETWRPDVLFHYTSTSDIAGHTWIGALDPRSPSHDPRLAERLWPYYTRIFHQLDAWLGEVLEVAPPETVITILSDHGMAGTTLQIHPNRILELEGLLYRTEDGEIDLSRTRILAADSEFFLRVNDQRFQGGIVAPEEREVVIRQAKAALLRARDPETGAKLFAKILRSEELASRGLGLSKWVGDLHLDPAPGYYLHQDLAEETVVPMEPWGQGTHGFLPDRREMHAVFYVIGPGVRPGVTIPPIRQIDIAPTLSRLLGIPAPAESQGQLLEAILAEQP